MSLRFLDSTRTQNKSSAVVEGSYESFKYFDRAVVEIMFVLFFRRIEFLYLIKIYLLILIIDNKFILIIFIDINKLF